MPDRLPMRTFAIGTLSPSEACPRGMVVINRDPVYQPISVEEAIALRDQLSRAIESLQGQGQDA